MCYYVKVRSHSLHKSLVNCSTTTYAYRQAHYLAVTFTAIGHVSLMPSRLDDGRHVEFLEMTHAPADPRRESSSWQLYSTTYTPNMVHFKWDQWPGCKTLANSTIAIMPRVTRVNLTQWHHLINSRVFYPHYYTIIHSISVAIICLT